MIITPSQATKQISDTNLELKVGPDEPPPTYSYAPPIDSEPGASGASRTFKTKPTNFLALSNDHDTIHGEFVIDPCIHIPSSVLPPLDGDQTEHDRKHLSLKSAFSSVYAEIWLLNSQGRPGGSGKPRTRRTTIALASGHGAIHAQVHTLEGAAPFSLVADAPHGSVRLALPRSFQGLICLSTRHGSIALSDALIQNATQLSQLGSTRRYFVGDFSLLGDEVWQGDQVEVEAVHGSIRLKYVDEKGTADRRKRGLFGRLFGH